MTRMNSTLAAVLFAVAATGCTTMQDREQHFSSLSCSQLSVAMAYERKAERDSRRMSALNGLASIVADDDDDVLLGLDSDINFIDADNNKANMQAIQSEMERRCQASHQE